MSYSFSITAPSKTKAIEAVVFEISKVVVNQQIHAAEARVVVDAAAGFISALQEDLNQDILVSINGSVWWTDVGLRQVSCNIGTQLVAKPAEIAHD